LTATLAVSAAYQQTLYAGQCFQLAGQVCVLIKLLRCADVGVAEDQLRVAGWYASVFQ